MSKNLTDFLNLLKNQREVSLIIAKDNQEQEQFIQELKTKDFAEIKSIFAYAETNSNKYLIINDEQSFKEIYDFICQYPVTVIKLYNQKDNKNIVINPDYNYVITFLITKDYLNKFTQSGLDILGRVGLTFQS